MPADPANGALAALPDDPALPPVPSDATGPVFAAPWEARAFAMVVSLYRAGHFTWPEWVATISAEIRKAQAQGDPDLGGSYYRHWLAALEVIMVAKRLTSDSELRVRQIECAANPPSRHDHPARREPVSVQ